MLKKYPKVDNGGFLTHHDPPTIHIRRLIISCDAYD
jgi:hypothetical protein